MDMRQLRLLCDELRQFLVLNVAKTGGHLASNLGIVELTVALERVFDTSKDRLLFDVGHQSYVHKILTGRRAEFTTLRSYGGLSRSRARVTATPLLRDMLLPPSLPPLVWRGRGRCKNRITT